MLLVDQQMPDMTGVEFLRAATRIHPHAKRVLLTEETDAEAAIQGINQVDLDCYLRKPWAPAVEASTRSPMRFSRIGRPGRRRSSMVCG